MNKESHVVAVVGAQWGDEGKGKVIDLLAAAAAVVIRSLGGDNAGHTVVNKYGKFGLHLVPAGIFNPETLNILERGVMINPESLTAEMDKLAAAGVSLNKLFISPHAHLVFDFHRYLDQGSRGREIGTTGRGIGPATQDKVGRIGLRVEDLLDPERSLKKLAKILSGKRRQYRRAVGREAFEVDYYEPRIRVWRERLAPHIVNTSKIIDEQRVKGGNFLLEGAQATMLSLEGSDYPYVTGSCPTATGLLLGAGLSPKVNTYVLGIFKAYATRVGGGPFPTERKDGWSRSIRNKGNERGVTTGRNRRIGDFDLVAGKAAQRENDFNGVILTRIDTGGDMGGWRICRRYQIDGEIVDTYPVFSGRLARATAYYEGSDYYKGWSENDVKRAEKATDLPPEVRRYLEAIRNGLGGVPIVAVGTGEGREGVIYFNKGNLPFSPQ